jgi:hypothetical protein
MTMRWRARAIAACAGAALVACQSQGPTKEEAQIASETIDCDHGGLRLLIRFTEGEARILMPDGNRVILYQVPVTTSAAVRYTNGLIELRGRGLDFDMQQDRQTVHMICKAYEIPKPKE